MLLILIYEVLLVNRESKGLSSNLYFLKKKVKDKKWRHLALFYAIIPYGGKK